MASHEHTFLTGADVVVVGFIVVVGFSVVVVNVVGMSGVLIIGDIRFKCSNSKTIEEIFVQLSTKICLYNIDIYETHCIF